LSPTLIPATLARRYKRFLADVVLEKRRHAHRPLSPIRAPCTGLDRQFSRFWLSNSENPMRKPSL